MQQCNRTTVFAIQNMLNQQYISISIDVLFVGNVQSDQNCLKRIVDTWNDQRSGIDRDGIMSRMSHHTDPSNVSADLDCRQ